MKSGIAVGEINNIGDALQLLRLDRILDAVDDALRPHVVGQFGDHNSPASGLHLLYPGACSYAERTAACLVCLGDPIEANDHAASGKVWPWNEGHEVRKGRVRMEK